MSAVGEIFNREINGEVHQVEAVTAYMGVYQNPVNEFWYAIDWSHKHRAAFQTPETARKWCRTASQVFNGIPQSNAEINQFNDAMWGRGWIVTKLLGNCQVWEERKDWGAAS